LQHILESSHCPNDHHVGTDGRRMTSYGSTVAASEVEGPPKPAELDALEAEIETIKADIQILRVGAESMHQNDILHTSDRQSDLPFRVEGSRIPAPVNRQSAAKTGGGGSKRGEVKALCSKTSLLSNIPNSHLTPSTHSTPPSPHFAQPTQAATRRVHQTLRKDASPAKASTEQSPGKSTRAKASDFATDKRAAQRHQKRTSLPQSWAMSTPPMPESNTLKYHPGDPDRIAEFHSAIPLGTTGSVTPSTNAQPAEQAPKTTTPQKQKTATPTKPSSAEQSPRTAMLRKETSNYMSSTAAAQRRSRAAVDTASRNARIVRLNTAVNKIAQEKAEAEARTPTSLAVYNSNIDRPPSFGYVGLGRPTAAMKLPMPLPHIANTVVTRQEPDYKLLDPIKAQLLKEGLLRSDPAQEQPAIGVHRGNQTVQQNNPKHVLKHLDKDEISTIFISNAYEGPPLRHAQDPSNEPISRSVTGLRGQSSANIGRALESDQPAVPVTSDPALLYKGPKPSRIIDVAPSSDFAILYQSRKLSTDLEPKQGPELVFKKEASQPGSLRATAMTFVPAPEPVQMRSTQFGGLGHLLALEPSWLGYNQDFTSGETPTISPISGESFSDLNQDYNNGVGIHDEQRWNAVSAAEPPFQDPAHLEFRGDFIGRGTQAVQPYSFNPLPEFYSPSPFLPNETPTSTSMPIPSTLALSSENVRTLPWVISGQGRRPFDWIGGNGIEIAFRGTGPDAEHDPNRPVEFRDLHTNTRTVHSPRHHGATSTSPPTAPRSMREQAKKMNNYQVPRTDEQQEGK
jgi:hypothetical protein